MSDFVPFVIVGLVTGSVYGLAGVGLVLTYKTSGVFNFAHGAIATAAAYAFYELHVRRDVAWPIALALCVVALGTVIGLLLERLARALAVRAPAMQIVGTVGVLLAVQSLAVARWGGQTLNVSPYLPTETFRVAGANVGYDQLIVFIVASAATALLYMFFRATRLGLAMQAVVDNPELLATGGTSPVRVRSTAWIVGSMFACVTGVLLVPFVGLDAAILTLLVVQAFGAAAIGAFRHLVTTYVGGLVVGVAAALSTKYIGQQRWLAGFPSAVPFAVLFVVLLAVPKHRLGVTADVKVRARAAPSAPRAARISGLVVVAAGVVAVPHLVGARLPVYTNGVVYVGVLLSLHLLVRVSGQVSLAHASFAAVGGVGFAHFSSGAGLPWLLALVAAGLLTAPVGALVAVPAIRLPGVYLAVATFGFAILLEKLVFPMRIMFGVTGIRNAARPDVWGLSGDTGYYYTVVAVTAGLAAVGVAVMRTRLGRLLRALADSPLALATHGTDANVARVLVFSISAFMAGIAGALFAGLTGSISATSFTYFRSLEWLVVMVIAGALVRFAPLPTALVGAAALAVVPSYFRREVFHEYLPVLFGVTAIAHALLSDRPSGHSPRRARRSADDQAVERQQDRPTFGGAALVDDVLEVGSS